MDRAGRSELHYAAAEGDAGSCEQLIAGGEDVNRPDASEWTPLHFAAQSQSEEAVRVLLDAGAEVDVPNVDGNTALWVSLVNYRGNGRVPAVLIDHGADPMIENRAGVSPRGLAKLVANYDLMQFMPGAEK